MLHLIFKILVIKLLNYLIIYLEIKFLFLINYYLIFFQLETKTVLII